MGHWVLRGSEQTKRFSHQELEPGRGDKTNTLRTVPGKRRRSADQGLSDGATHTAAYSRYQKIICSVSEHSFNSKFWVDCLRKRSVKPSLIFCLGTIPACFRENNKAWGGTCKWWPPRGQEVSCPVVSTQPKHPDHGAAPAYSHTWPVLILSGQWPMPRVWLGSEKRRNWLQEYQHSRTGFRLIPSQGRHPLNLTLTPPPMLFSTWSVLLTWKGRDLFNKLSSAGPRKPFTRPQ